jgi:predicted TIM-barrel fold metal-dependent hydrolase
MKTTRRGFLGVVGAATLTALLPGISRGMGSTTESGPRPARITAIDTHAHIFRRGLKLASVRRYVPDYDAELTNYLSALDANGISHGVLVQPSFLGTDNSFLLDALQRQPERIRGIAVVEPNISKPELVKLDNAGFVGIRLNLVGLPIPDFRSNGWPSLLRIVADLGWQVELHRAASDLPPVVEALLKTGVNVMIDHFGLPDKNLGVNDPGFRALIRTASSRRVWIKLSGMYRTAPGNAAETMTRAAVPLLKETFGLERMVWGSDWPHTNFEKTINYPATRAHLDMWLPDAAERKIVLVDTPAKLFRFNGQRG